MIRRLLVPRYIISILFTFLSPWALAEHIKVDLDARHDATAEGFLSWQPDEGLEKVFGDIRIQFSLVDSPASTEPKISWHNKNGLNHYELAMDCLYAYFDDGSTNHPSFEPCELQMTLSGLAEGSHTLITYHNAPWPESKYKRTISPCKILINGQMQATVEPTQDVKSDQDIASTFITFNAKADQPLQITFVPVASGLEHIATPVLSGFEIDNPAPIQSYASAPSPPDGSEHVSANNDEPAPGSAAKGQVELFWKPSPAAVRHDVYLGTSRTEVEKATPETEGIYRGRQYGANTFYPATGLHSRETYCWRIDSIREDGSITKGPVWSFRTRHPAYPGAEGYGRFARGGRYGRIIEVTTLEDYDTEQGEAVIDGSLRKAVEFEKGPRIVIFRVGGTIFLKKRLIIPADGGDVTIAGQTAPGDGICVARYSFGMLSTHDAVIRFIRTRVGDYSKKALDGMGMSNCDHCIIDHCSISWSLDEGHSSRSAKNITFSRNIIAEALNNSYHYGKHSFAGSISGNRGSYHHNLLAHCAGRNWSLAGGLDQSGQYAGYCDIRNNVVYNWKHRTTDGGIMRCNFVNNLYIPGPVTDLFLLMRPDGDQMKTGNPQKFYITGNKMVGKPEFDKDNWRGVKPNYAEESEIRSDEPFFPSFVKTHTVEELYANVLADVGATRPKRDVIDTRIIEDVKKRGFTFRGSKDRLPGIIDSQEDVGGYPTLKGGPAPADSDHDGLPDWWEKKHKLDVHSSAGDFSDPGSDPDQDGFTQMDDYLEYLAQGGQLIPE